MTRQKGFTIVEIVIAVAVVGLLALLAWRFWDASQSKTDDNSSQQSSQQAPDINSEDDLDKASKVLDEMNVEGEEAKQVNTETSF